MFMFSDPEDPDPIYDVPRRATSSNQTLSATFCTKNDIRKEVGFEERYQDEQRDHSEDGYQYLEEVVTPRWQNVNPEAGKCTFMDTGKLYMSNAILTILS